MNKKYWFAINYKCKDVDSRNYLVKAENAIEAWNLFINEWREEYKNDDVGYINPQDLKRFEVYQLCESKNIIF